MYNYLFDFISQSKLYYILYLLLLPILPLARNFIIPELLGDFYNNLHNKKYSKTILFYIIFSYFTMYTSTLFVNYMAWRVIPTFYEYVIFRIYDYIYENTFCNYDNLNISEIILKISKMSGIFNSTLRAFKEDFCNIFISVFIGLFYFYFKLGLKYLYMFIFFFIFMTICQIYNILYNSRINKIKGKFVDKVYSSLSDSLYNISSVHIFQNKKHEKHILKNKLLDYKKIFQKSVVFSLFFDGLTKYLNMFMIEMNVYQK